MSNLKNPLENPPPPALRPRQRKPTAKELRERYDIVAQLLGRKTKGQIHDFCRERWGVCWRTSDAYVARAREGILAALDTTKLDMRAQSYRFYVSVTVDPAATISEKLRAQQRIDELLGLDLPNAVEASGPGGKELAAAPQVVLYLPDNGRYDPAPGTPRAANRDAAEAGTQPANGKR